MKTSITLLFSAILTTTAAFGQTTILWNESVNGELSFVLPATPLGTVQVGTDSIIGSAELTPFGAGWGADDNLFTFSVPSNLQVVKVQLTVDRPIDAWIGDQSFSYQYGDALSPSNGDLLTQWGINSLDSGVYGMYISDFDLESYPTAANYQLDFVVEPVPEPSPVGLLLLGTIVFTLRPCRKSRQPPV